MGSIWQSAVMRNTERRNGDDWHNATITARPVILFKTDGSDLPQAALVRQILRSKLIRLREFTPQYLVPGTSEHRLMEASTTPEDRATLRAISLIRYAHTSGADANTTSKALYEAARALVPDYPANESAFSEFQRGKVPERLYAGLLTQGMKGTKLVMWTTKQGEIVPALLCGSLRSALFVASAYRAVTACANCHRLFALDSARIDGSASEKYCSAACGQRFRQKMYRLRTANRKKKSKRGRRK
jgi:hypothetical protein